MASDPAADRPHPPLIQPSWASVTVSVADLDTALALWRDTLGFEVRARHDGDDDQLARLWNLEDIGIRRQALIATPGERHGMIHLVEFVEPGPAIRENAQAFDEVPKNLDIYVQDLPGRVNALREAGRRFRNEQYSEVTAPDGTLFREIHMPSHDALNVVLLEVVGKPLPFNAAGFAGVGPLIVIVRDAARERDFYRDVMGFSLLSDNLLKGPEIERMVGLPSGSALDVSIWGDADAPFGQIEVIDYRGVKGEDLYPLTLPPNRGILHTTYAVADLDAFARRLHEAGIRYSGPVEADVLPGRGRYVRFRTPAGLNLEAFQPASD